MEGLGFFIKKIWRGVLRGRGGEVKPAPPAEPKAYSTVTSRMNEFVSETGRQINAAITDFFARFQKGAQQ